MKRTIKNSLILTCLLALLNVSAALPNFNGDYMRLHSDIQVAIEDLNIKKARSIIKTLLPMIDSDIEYTASIISEEQDEFYLKQLNERYERQKEIRENLQGLLKLRRADDVSEESLNMIRELRKLSLKPRTR